MPRARYNRLALRGSALLRAHAAQCASQACFQAATPSPAASRPSAARAHATAHAPPLCRRHSAHRHLVCTWRPAGGACRAWCGARDPRVGCTPAGASLTRRRPPLAAAAARGAAPPPRPPPVAHLRLALLAARSHTSWRGTQAAGRRVTRAAAKSTGKPLLVSSRLLWVNFVEFAHSLIAACLSTRGVQSALHRRPRGVTRIGPGGTPRVGTRGRRVHAGGRGRGCEGGTPGGTASRRAHAQSALASVCPAGAPSALRRLCAPRNPAERPSRSRPRRNGARDGRHHCCRQRGASSR